MELTLERFAYTPTETQGRLLLPSGTVLWSVEQEWTAAEDGTAGGEPFESCIPDGRYDLFPYVRGRDESKVFVMVNQKLGVYHHEHEMPEGVGRFLCEIHRANYARQVEGCVAIGLRRRYHENQVMVTSSRLAMDKLRTEIPWKKGHTLLIRPAVGTTKPTLPVPNGTAEAPEDAT